MPLYEYECDACAHRFEKIQKFSDPTEDTCPKCGGTVKKLVSSPAIQFKGSGWYITDYAKKGSTDSSNRKSSDKGESVKSDSGKSDSSTGGESASNKGSDSAASSSPPSSSSKD